MSQDNPDLQEILPRVVEIVKTQFVGHSTKNYQEELPTRKTRISQYHPDHLDWLEFVMALEEGFDIEITDQEQETWIEDEDTTVGEIAEFVTEKLLTSRYP